MLRGGILRAFAALALCALSGCASNSYMGIPLSQPTASEDQAELQALAKRARAGDRYAQLELGIAFEEGRGVARDLRKAEKLYRLAATGSGGTMWVYSPPVRSGASGQVLPVDRGAVQPGLPEAATRLAALRAANFSGASTETERDR